MQQKFLENDRFSVTLAFAITSLPICPSHSLHDTDMPPQSASKQKRLAEKAAKQAAKQKGAVSSTTTSTPTGSINGSSATTPVTSLSLAGSTEDLNAMEKLKLATER